MVIDMKDYEREIQAEIAQLRKNIAPLEDGTVTLRSSEGDQPWADITAETIAFNKRTIAIYEKILQDLRERNARN